MPQHSMFRGIPISDLLKEFSDKDEKNEDSPEETFFQDELEYKERLVQLSLSICWYENCY